MRRLGIGCIILVLIAIVIGLCFTVLDDDEVEIEEGAVEEVGSVFSGW